MITSYSKGLGSEYVVYRAADKTIIPDAVVIIKETLNRLIHALMALVE
jgi:hypothetical protein